jgi:cyclophilin family peptidyl-prolyl cis-trans isomerase
MTKYLLALAATLIIFSTGCISNEGNGETTAIIDTNKGIIKVKLFVDEMPTTTDNFIKLVNDGFYDGLLFHRIKENFMIQGGLYDVSGTVKASPYGAIPFETHPDITHVDGAISMARGADINTASSQFFICDGAQHSLDDEFLQQYGQRGYAAFGVVTEGIEIVRLIAESPHDSSLEPSPGGGTPLENIIINSITLE